jgi:hypothetical protein
MSAQPDNHNWWSRRIVHTGVLLATLAAAAATVLVLLQPARPPREIVVPPDSTPLSTAVTPNVSQPVPTQQPGTVAGEPPATMPPPPTTRAPISVSPESLAPFANRTRPGRTASVAWLLGGLL